MKKDLIEAVLHCWDISDPYIKDAYGKEAEDIPRIICRIGTETCDYVLKGIRNIPETTIISNVQAYLFLGNRHALAPRLYPTKEGTFYIRKQEYFFYLMEYIDGRQMEENVSDEYKIGQLTRKLHSFENYEFISPLTQSKK